MIDNQGEKIKALRKSAGLTQTKFAIKCGLSLATIQRIEPLKVVPKGALNSICNAMNWDIKLITGNGEILSIVSEQTVKYDNEVNLSFVLKEIMQLKDRVIELEKRVLK